MNTYQAIVLLHVAFGTVALATYWTAGLVKKGTPLHRRTGQAYLLAMCGILGTGLPMVVAALRADKPNIAAFLAFLLLLVAQACWTAWRAIRDRPSPERFFGKVYWGLTGACVLAGLAMVALGLHIGQPIFAVFGGIGALAGIGALRARRRSATDPKWWLKEHYGAMIGNGVATHIAFFGIGLRSLLPGVDPALLQNFAWFAPLAASFVAAAWLDRKYGRPAKAQTSPSSSQPSPVPRV